RAGSRSDTCRCSRRCRTAVGRSWRLRWSGAALRRLPRPEIIHAAECIRIRGLEAMPVRKVGQGRVVGECRAVARDRWRIELEAKQSEIMLAKECADLRKRQPVLLHMEQEIAARARTEEIRRMQDRDKA